MDPESPRGIKLVRLLRIPLFVLLAAYWAFAVVGCLSRRWIDRWHLIILAVVSAYLLLVPAFLNLGYNRFRYPVTPVICLMAGCGLYAIANRFGISSIRFPVKHEPRPGTTG